jgi:multiple sugar transport system substrate-binding protein
MGGPLGKTLDTLIAEFEQNHPGIKITGVSMGNYDALSQKIMAAVMAGDPPTMAQAYENWTTQLMEGNAIVCLDDFVHGPRGLSAEELADFYPIFIEDNSWGGKLYSFPFNKSVPALYYNKDMFKKAGLDPEHFPETWEDFVAAARTLTVDANRDGTPEQWGTAFPVGVWAFGCLLYQNGGAFTDPGEKKATFNGPEGIGALQYLLDQIVTDKVAYLTTGFEHQNGFLSGKVAMIQSSIASSSYMRPAIKFDMGVAPLPCNKRDAVVLAGTNVVIFAKASPEQRQAAWDFLKWFSSPEITARWADGSGYLPLRRSALTLGPMPERLKEHAGWKGVFDQLEHAYFEPRSKAWFDMRSYFEEVLEGALRGKISCREALNRAAERYDRAAAK